MNNIESFSKAELLEKACEILNIEYRVGRHQICPFHNEKTPSFFIFPNGFWHCFGSCQKGGDWYTLFEKHNISFVNALEKMGLSSSNEQFKSYFSLKSSLKKYLDEFYLVKLEPEWELVDLFPYKDVEGQIHYFHAKFLQESGSKTVRPFTFDAVKNKWYHKMPENLRLPYNAQYLKNNTIYLVEGTKDADNLTNLGYPAVSFKEIGKAEYDNWSRYLEDKNVYFFADTGEAGEQFAYKMYKAFSDIASNYRQVILKGIEYLGDNADVSDWLMGKSKKDLQTAIETSCWDRKHSPIFPVADVKKYVKTDKHGEVTQERIVVTAIDCYANFKAFLNYKGIKLKYNILTRRNEFVTYFQDAPTEDIGLGLLENEISSARTVPKFCKFNVLDSRLGRYFSQLAKENAYSPLVEHFDKCHQEWVSLGRGNQILSEFMNALDLIEREDEALNEEAFFHYTWMIVTALKGAMAMGFNSPFIKHKLKWWKQPLHVEGMLIFYGNQELGKSHLTEKLGMKSVNSDFYKQVTAPNFKDKDELKQIGSSWFIEQAEFDAGKKSDFIIQKGWITRAIDEYRDPYARTSEQHARTSALFGTVNSENFLKDATGNRRYWIVPLQFIDHDRINNINFNELWGFIYDLLLIKKQDLRLPRETQKFINVQNLGNTLISVEQQLILDAFDWTLPLEAFKFIRASELNTMLGTKRNSPATLSFAVKFLQEKNELPIDYVIKKRGDSGNLYCIPPINPDYEIDDNGKLVPKRNGELFDKNISEITGTW